jgi:hypothetical protein
MTPREHAWDALRTMLLPPDEHPGELAIAEATIRAAGEPLAAALRAMLEHYTSLVNCGNWDPETEAEVIAARAALAAWEAK